MSTSRYNTALISTDVTVRRATDSDAPALHRLAVLDSQRYADAAMLVAEVGGRIVAARSLAGRTVIADPFERTTAAVELLDLRAGQLAAPASRSSKPLTRATRRLALARAH